ncbi:MAG TPA: neutral zinc metallopeptidase [Longimicrobiales bacterium]|nr:neutral zinc metallopeptidase [Longimicrobiales bacterium]
MVLWKRSRQSTNVRDLRGRGRGGLLGGGCLTVVIIIVALVLGVDPRPLLQMGDAVQQQQQSTETGAPPADDEQARFVAAILGDTEDVWNRIFTDNDSDYQEPVLTLFSGAVRSGCGNASAAMGPFYCPLDAGVYLDMSFFRELSDRFGAPGDFAAAYVIAHEVGHHVQNLTGVSDRVRRAQQAAAPAEANTLSVRLELQADCYAGIWAHHAQAQRQILEPGDIEEGLTAAAAIGDDRLQSRAGGAVVPESFTHGTSRQRVDWFTRGYRAGDPDQCDTFGATSL